MERALTPEEAGRVVMVKAVGTADVRNGHGRLVVEHRATLVPLDPYGAPGFEAVVSEQEARTLRSFPFASRDDEGAFGVQRLPDGTFVREAPLSQGAST